jgi:hypothetical protein
MKPPKARMGVLAEKLGILEVGRGGGSAVAPNDKKKKNVKKVLRTTKNINVEDQKIALSKLVLNPPHGEKDNFAKITVTLPSPIRRLLLDESHRRKTERDPNWSISVVVREALAAYLGTQGGVLHKDEEGREL